MSRRVRDRFSSGATDSLPTLLRNTSKHVSPVYVVVFPSCTSMIHGSPGEGKLQTAGILFSLDSCKTMSPLCMLGYVCGPKISSFLFPPGILLFLEQKNVKYILSS